MRRPARLTVSLVVLLVAACLPPPVGRELTSEFPAVSGRDRGTVDLDRLPISLLDLTGLAISIDVVEPALDAGAQPLAGVAGAPGSLQVFWLGGACSARVRIVFQPAESDRYRLGIDEESSLGGMLGCPAIGISRTVRIELRRPVDLDRIIVEAQ